MSQVSAPTSLGIGLVGNSGRLVVGRNGRESPLPFDHILVATGRRPETDDLGLDAAGVEGDEWGAVRVDATLRTTASRIFAAAT